MILSNGAANKYSSKRVTQHLPSTTHLLSCTATTRFQSRYSLNTHSIFLSIYSPLPSSFSSSLPSHLFLQNPSFRFSRVDTRSAVEPSFPTTCPFCLRLHKFHSNYCTISFSFLRNAFPLHTTIDFAPSLHSRSPFQKAHLIQGNVSYHPPLT